MFYRVSSKESLNERNRIFLDYGIPTLQNKDFSKSPFDGIWYGEYNKDIKGYSYELCRLNGNYLENLTVHILENEEWIQIYLNIFELIPRVNSLLELKGKDSIKFQTLPNGLTKMRLRSDDYKGPPLFYMLFSPEHKIGKYSTKQGYKKEVLKLERLIKSDMDNIESFVKRWHELHVPQKTDWEGNTM